MAGNCSNLIRVRLYFDYPPPTVTSSRMCLMLVDLNKCRVVADLASLIREKFCFSRKIFFSLFIADCYLPHSESVNVVRDDDSITVKVENLLQKNGVDYSFNPEHIMQKRRRDAEEESTENEVELKYRKKKKNKNNTAHLWEVTHASNVEGDVEKCKITEKNKVQSDVQRTTKSTNSLKTSNTVAKLVKIPKGKLSSTKRQTVSLTDLSYTNSEEDGILKETTFSKAVTLKKAKAKATKSCPKPSHFSSNKVTSTNSSTEALGETHKKKSETLKSTNGVGPSNQSKTVRKQMLVAPDLVKNVRENGSVQSCSDEKIKLITKQPINRTDKLAAPVTCDSMCNYQDMGLAGTEGREELITLCTRRSNGTSQGFNSNYEEKHPQQKQSFQSGSTINHNSVMFKSPSEGFAKRDYSVLPLLAAPPQIGQKIAFKLLELSENYTPEVSAYKEGKIVNIDPITKQTELELLDVSQVQPAEPGKFDLVYQNADGSETVVYAVSRGSMVTECWESLLEPRLII